MNALILSVTSPDDSPGEPPATFVLRDKPAVLGRDPHCDLVVDHATVSSRHAELSPTSNTVTGFTYKDLGSTNGSALVRGATTVPCRPGEPIPLQPGDVLLLGDATRPLRVEVELDPTRPPERPPLTRTVVARAPLFDPLSGPLTGPLVGTPTSPQSEDRLATMAAIAARAMTAIDARSLADTIHAALTTLCPHAARRGVSLWGPALATNSGDPLPDGLRELALSGRLQVAELASLGGDLPLPQTRSLVQTNTSAALLVPLTTGGASWGVAFSTSPLGAAAFPSEAAALFGLLGPLFGLAADKLSRRLLSASEARLAPPDDGPAGPLGISPSFVEVVALTRQVASADVAVLIHGETGSGKEVLARYLHQQSRRRAAPFVAFNCAAIPENLIESELFGHVRGAFTSASTDRKGLFEEAHGGSLFLDEIGEMPLSMQAKLLRVLQDGEVRRVGANKTTTVDVRVVSATHRDLVTLASEGRFRSDLMYRLNTITLSLPPLRERPEDIPLLAHAFLARAARQANKHLPGFAPDALWALSLHPFPGNVRELDNEVMRAVALTSDGEAVSARVFSPALRDRAPAPTPTPKRADTSGAEPPIPLREAVAAAERAAIERALAATSGNVTEAARLLEVTRPGLYKAMERLGLK